MSECVKTLLLVRTGAKHEKIMIFGLKSKIVDPIFEGSRQSQMSWCTRKKHFFRTGSFLEQSYMYEVTQKNKKPTVEHPQGSEIDEGIFSLR